MILCGLWWSFELTSSKGNISFENEEKWMNECQETFLRLEVDAKMFIENIKRNLALVT